MSKFDDLAVSIESRRVQVFQDQQNQAGPVRVTLVLSVTAIGEAAEDVAFPMAFVDEPAVSFGCVYAGTTGANPVEEWTPSSMPVFSVVVLGWIKQQTNGVLYTGATLGIVTDGALADNFRIQAHFEGTAVRSASK